MAEQLEIRATEFNKEEMNRILGILRETDPRSRDYVQVLDSFERFLYFGNVIAAAQDLVSDTKEPIRCDIPSAENDNIIQFPPPVDEEEKFEVVEEPEEKFDPAVVKKAIQDARMQGKLSSAKDWIKQEFGVDGFSAIPASKYGEVMTKLKELA